MSESRCLSCVALEQKVINQQRQIVALERRIKALEQKIEFARRVAFGIINEADGVMTSHCPRGTWAMAKGKKAAATEIESCLS